MARLLLTGLLLLLVVVVYTEAFTVSSISRNVNAQSAVRLLAPHRTRWIVQPFLFPNGKDNAQRLRNNYNEASEQVLEAELRVEQLEKQIKASQLELSKKQKELNDTKSLWDLEKLDFTNLISELTNLIAGADKEAQDSMTEINKGGKKRQEALADEILTIQTSLQEAQDALKLERAAAEELKNRIMTVEDQLEFEQMRFEKEKIDLSENIQNEREKLNSIESQFKQERKRFQVDRDMLQQQIQEESSKLEQAEITFREELKRFETERNYLKRMLQQQSSKVAESAKELMRGEVQYKGDKASLEKALEKEKSKLVATEQLLAEEQVQFEQVKSDLEMKIVYEKNRVKQLSTQLDLEEESFRQQKQRLEVGIATEKQNIRKVEQDLQDEQMVWQDIKTQLQDRINDGEQLRRQKTKEMSQKFSEIREELNARWQEERKNAREERRKLAEKYDDAISKASENVRLLNVDLQGTKQLCDELRNMYDEMTQEKEMLLKEREASEERYIRTLENRDGMILDLRKELDDLYDEIYHRDQTITKYETSLRQLFGLSIQLTKKRVGRVFRGRDEQEV